MTHIVIIGAGECGARAAFGLREKGFGGEITLIGASRTFPMSGRRFPRTASRRPPCRNSSRGRALRRSADCGADRRHGGEHRPRAQSVTLSDGESLDYDRLLLATGARPRAFPRVPENAGRIRTLRTHADALAIRGALTPGARLAVIGGGFIGLELAATARKLGAEVVLVEGLPRVLSRGVPEEIAVLVAERHRREGVEIICGAQIAAIDEAGDGARLLLADGVDIEADLIVVGIGAVPNTELAEAAGLAIENGIAVDERLCTSDPDIYAAGDCCSFPLPHYGGRRVRLEAWRNAQDQGALAAVNLMGAGETMVSVPWFWSDQYEFTLQIAGLADGAETTVRRDMEEGAFILFHLDGEGRLIAASGIGPGNAVARESALPKC